MFGRHHPRPGPTVPDVGAGLFPPTPRACAELLEALDRFAALQAFFSRNFPPEEEVAEFLDAHRVAKGECNRLAEAVLRSRPRTAAEAATRREVIAVYLVRTGVDQLPWLPHLETDPAGVDSARQFASSAVSKPGHSALWKGLLKWRHPANPA